jgi:hypothetical protein
MSDQHHYSRLATLSIEEVLGWVRLSIPTVLIEGCVVNIKQSLRLRTFLKTGTRCHNCGLEATHFAAERGVTQKKGPYHFNLWGGPSGAEILFTCDHLIARGLGGRDNIKNTETLCKPCNSRKASFESRCKDAMDAAKYFGNQILIVEVRKKK